jgi:hypothetical protein
MSSHVRPDVKASKALSMLHNEHVRPFIDRDRLVKSALFAEMVDMTVEHALRTGDFGYMNRLLEVLASSKHEAALLEWLCSRTGAKVRVKSGRAGLVRGHDSSAAHQPLASVFPTAVAAQQAAVTAAKLEAKMATLRVVKVSDKPKFIDMLDSPARLPGSFGAGKRR